MGVVIVDDEELARRVLLEYLAEHDDIRVLAECSNGFDAVKAVRELKPDLLLLDIQMPKLDGFEVLQLIEHKPAVIFVTAYDQYALQAFEVQAVDYLLKPFSAERLTQSLRLAVQRLKRKETIPTAQLLAAVHPKERPLERLVVQEGSRISVIPAGKIDYIEAQDDYACIKSASKEYLKQQTLAELEAILDNGQFVRIHRSYILNLDRLVRLEPYAKDSRIAILTDGTRLPVSRAGYSRLKLLL